MKTKISTSLWKIVWLKLKQMAFFIIFIFNCFFNVSYASEIKNLDYINSNFEKLEIDCKSIWFSPIKLNNGNILFIGSDYNYIFEPKINEIKKFKQKLEHLKIYTPILLKDNNILFVGANVDEPSEISNYAILYNLKTNTYKRVGKINVNREKPKALVLRNGQIIIWDGYPKSGLNELAGIVEIYDPQTQNFSILSDLYWRNLELFELANEKIFTSKGEIYDIRKNSIEKIKTDDFWVNPIILDNGNIMDVIGKYYNITKNELSRIKKLYDFNQGYTDKKYLKLPNNSILYFEYPNNLNIYYANDDKNTTKGHLLNERSNFNMIYLNNNKVLIYGGNEYNKMNKKSSIGQILYTGGRYQEHLEIFDIETGNSNSLKNKHSFYLYNPILLDDGRILFQTQNGYELLVPNVTK